MVYTRKDLGFILSVDWLKSLCSSSFRSWQWRHDVSESTLARHQLSRRSGAPKPIVMQRYCDIPEHADFRCTFR